MNTAEFLSYVVAPGNFLAVTINRTTGDYKGFSVRMFPRDDIAGAVGYIRWALQMGWDVYHSNASFKEATASVDGLGEVKYRGSKDAQNALALRSFWLDLDCKREGDKKDASKVFADQPAALTWLADMVQATGLPRPNLVVNSGYGLHAYWILEDALPVADWTPYAQRFKAAVLGHGFTGDAAVIGDAARILRPAGTNNYKVAASPAPVTVIAPLSAAEIPTATMLTALDRFAPAATTVIQATGTGGLQGSASVISLAAARQYQQSHGGSMAAAAAAGLTTAKPRLLANIEPKCEQLRMSLASGGNQDSYALWYLGWLSLAHFCADGVDYVHTLSAGDARYSPANVDSHVAQVAKEHATKQQGPPGCALFNAERANVCPNCPLWQKINSPWQVGADDGDLPSGYRRQGGFIEYAKPVKDFTVWNRLVWGDVHSPMLDMTRDGIVLSYTFIRNKKEHAVQAADAAMADAPGTLRKMFAQQGVTLDSGLEVEFARFMVSWIQELRQQNVLRAEAAYPYGWHITSKGFAGFAVAGELYLPNGSVERVAGGDRQIHVMYQPAGELAPWKAAADLVVKGRPALATIVAIAFASPLLKLTGQSGVVFSAWSQASGVGKSAAMTVGQAVWAQRRAMTATSDTANSISRKASEGRVMPVYWDETLVGQQQISAFVALVFQLAQGKERSRLSQDSILRETGEWNTIIMAAGNKPLMDTVLQETDGTAAGALRVFEYRIAAEDQPNDSGATGIIAKAETNHGHAGRVYARWLAANHDTAEKVVQAAMQGFTAELAAGREERLHIAGMACVYAGAAIAHSLGLVEFELPSLRAFLCDTFNELRAAREATLLANPNGYDLHQHLGRFIVAFSGQKLVTSCFARSGKGKPLVQIAPSLSGSGVVIQIGVDNKEMRLDRREFVNWARKQNLAGTDLADALVKAWGASYGRYMLGADTPYAGGLVRTIDLPLTRPDLEDYLPTPSAPAPTGLRKPPTL